jgi:hypothetical protein
VALDLKSAMVSAPLEARLLPRVAAGEPGAVRECVERYGGLFSAYVPNLPHWEAAVMFEKVLVAASGLLLGDFVMLQLIVLQGIFFISSSVYQAKKPFMRDEDNSLNTILRSAMIEASSQHQLQSRPTGLKGV